MAGDKAAGKRGYGLGKIIAGIIAGMGAFSCLIPAVSVNLAAHVSKGEAWHASAIFIVAVLVAAAAMIIRPIALRSNEKQVAFACLVLALACLSFNLKNAMTSVTISRAAYGDPRRAEMANIAAMKSEQNILANILAKSSQAEGAKSSQEWRAEIAAKEADPIFTRADRSNRCTNSTIQTSAVFCGERATFLAGLARAEDLERKQARLDAIGDQLRNVKQVSVMADPAVDNLVALAGFFISISDETTKYVGLGNDLHTAIFVELLAALGPSIFFFGFTAFAARRDDVIERDIAPAMASPVACDAAAQCEESTLPVAVAEPEPVANPDVRKPEKKPAPTKPLPPCVASFFDTNVTERRGGSIGATDFYVAYVASCSGDPVSQAKFGRAATATFKKSAGRTNVYVGISLKGRPALAAVRSN